MDMFSKALIRVENLAAVAPKCNGILTVQNLAKVFQKDWRVSKTGTGEINLYRPIKDGCEYATLSLDGDGLDRILTMREIQDGVPLMLRFQAE